MNGGVEHAAEVGAIDRTPMHADTDEATRELVHPPAAMLHYFEVMIEEPQESDPKRPGHRDPPPPHPPDQIDKPPPDIKPVPPPDILPPAPAEPPVPASLKDQWTARVQRTRS